MRANNIEYYQNRNPHSIFVDRSSSSSGAHSQQHTERSEDLEVSRSSTSCTSMNFAGLGNGWSDLKKHSSGRGGGGRGEGHQYYHCNPNSTLRFRPIAPKPSPNGSTSSSITFESKRTKRRYVRVKRTAGCKRKSKTSGSNDAPSTVSPDVVDTSQRQIVTLQLLPSEPVRASIASDGSDRSSWVTVECVTGVSTLASLRTDEEMRAALSRDACPAFISSGCHNGVEWVNDAFKRVVLEEGRVTEDKVAVSLEVDDGVLLECGAAFTCRVRWRYGKGGGMVLRTVLCDTWRLGSGGLAWRLDVCGALSLGLRASC